MEIKPLFDRVLLKPFNEKNTYQLITSHEEESNKMIVVSVGTKENFIVKENDIVLINDYTGYKFTINNESFILIKELDILAILTGEGK